MDQLDQAKIAPRESSGRFIFCPSALDFDTMTSSLSLLPDAVLITILKHSRISPSSKLVSKWLTISNENNALPEAHLNELRSACFSTRVLCDLLPHCFTMEHKFRYLSNFLINLHENLNKEFQNEGHVAILQWAASQPQQVPFINVDFQRNRLDEFVNVVLKRNLALAHNIVHACSMTTTRDTLLQALYSKHYDLFLKAALRWTLPPILSTEISVYVTDQQGFYGFMPHYHAIVSGRDDVQKAIQDVFEISPLDILACALKSKEKNEIKTALVQKNPEVQFTITEFAVYGRYCRFTFNADGVECSARAPTTSPLTQEIISRPTTLFDPNCIEVGTIRSMRNLGELNALRKYVPADPHVAARIDSLIASEPTKLQYDNSGDI